MNVGVTWCNNNKSPMTGNGKFIPSIYGDDWGMVCYLIIPLYPHYGKNWNDCLMVNLGMMFFLLEPGVPSMPWDCPYIVRMLWKNGMVQLGILPWGSEIGQFPQAVNIA